MNKLENILELESLLTVVDIGANPIDGEPPYKSLLKKGLCNVIGFEPQQDAFDKLQKLKSDNETYYQDIIGDGSEKTLNVCKASGMTSCFEPNNQVLDCFKPFKDWGQVVKQIPLKTKRLDDLEYITELDFLKIDVQGMELEIFQNGTEKLKNAVCVQTEVSFIQLYKNQPCFGEIDIELRKQGFIPHRFFGVKNWIISPLVLNNDPYQGLNQLLEADVVYMRDFTNLENLSNNQLKYMALIAHECYKSFDLALRCVTELEVRGALKKGSQTKYLNLASELL